MMKDFSVFEESIGVKFNTPALLQQAFVHRSYLNEHPDFGMDHNERLEFLGDAVLELVVTEFLYKNYPNPEGDLTNWRASLVNAIMLSQVAKDMNMEPYLFLSRGETKDKDSKARQYILANAIEALVGAIYLDSGYDVVSNFIHRFLLPRLPHILEEHLYLDAKSHFQELAQELVGVTPSYRVLEEVGPDHARQFKVGVFLADELVASGEGTSKQEAQMAAAKEALVVKNWK